MIDEVLLDALPDWVAFVRPDGVVTTQVGGRSLALIARPDGATGRHLRDVLPAEAATLILRLVRRSLMDRQSADWEYADGQATYEFRVIPQGPQRALCVIHQPISVRGDQADHARGAPSDEPQRLGFLTDVERRVADARLRERPLAVGVLLLEGLSDIGRSIDFAIADQLQTLIFAKLSAAAQAEQGPSCIVSKLGESTIGFVIEGTGDRVRVESIAQALYACATEPVRVWDAEFQLTAAIGVALLGSDASQADLLLEYARAAMFEARRSTEVRIQFYSDTLRLLPVARLDIERELRKAIAANQIGIEYLPRHDLDSGVLTGLHTYMRWTHPVWGDIAPSQFLPVADATGLAAELSRAALKRLAADCTQGRIAADVPVSFGPLRQHIGCGQLIEDCRALLAEGHVCISRFEVRIAERTLTSLPAADRTLDALASVGAHLIIDEVGRQVSPISRLAQLPLSALQIDRALVVASRKSVAARRCCRSIAALAQALEVSSIAGGIDDEETRTRMSELGCRQGMGDLYAGRERGSAEERTVA